MSRRVTVLLVSALVVLVSAGSFEAALAASGGSGIPTTQAVTACATGMGLLRLQDGSGKCPRGDTGVQLSRPAVAPHAVSVNLVSRGPGTTRKAIPLIAGVSLVAGCRTATPLYWTGTGGLQIAHTGATQIDGTAFVTENGMGSGASYQYVGGQPLPTPEGASGFFANGAGTLGVTPRDDQQNGFATENVHLLVTVAGAAFTVDAVLDVNGDTHTCRVSTEVETATL